GLNASNSIGVTYPTRRYRAGYQDGGIGNNPIGYGMMNGLVRQAHPTAGVSNPEPLEKHLPY
ncbi:MAG: hypothetical protein ABW147_12160, partial [Candidatus Thiodiazotropha sp.]